MRRISPIWVLLLAAGYANAGISDWFNPFRWNHKHQGVSAAASSAPSHNPKSSGHRGSRQLLPSHGLNIGHKHGSSHISPYHPRAPPAPLLGSLPGSLDDGFKPSFPPGFANPPSYSPNLNPFATIAGTGSEAIAKGPFLPSQLTQYHTPKVDPDHANAPLAKAAPLPERLKRAKHYHQQRFPFGGRKSRLSAPPHAAVASASALPDGSGPVNPDGSPVAYTEFPGLASAIEPMDGGAAEYEETPTTPPQAAPQRGPRGPFSFLRSRHRPSGPRSHGQGQQHFRPGRQFGRPNHSGPPAGPPGGPQGPEGPSFNIDGSGPDQQNPFGGDGPQGNPFGNDGPGPSQGFFGGSDGPQQNPFGNQEQQQNLFASSGPLGGGPGSHNGGSPLAGPSFGGGNRPGQDVFFASSPGSNTPFAPVIPEQGPGGPSPFGNPQSNSQFGQGQSRPGLLGSLFGRGNQNSPQRPPQGRPGGHGENNGPQHFFGPNGNDYPEQFEGGNRGIRQGNNQISQDDYRPQPNGPPGDLPGPNDQSPGFFGALHDSENGPQLSNFFGGNNGPNSQDGSSGPGGPPSHNNGPSNGASYFGNINHGGNNPFPIHNIQAEGEGGPGFRNNPQSNNGQRGRKPQRFSFRNPLASVFGSSSSLPSHNANLNVNNNPQLAMAATGAKPAVSLPAAAVKGAARSLLRPFIRKPGAIIPLSSPKDPNYHPMRLGASSLSPMASPFEPDTAASGGYGGYGGHSGLSHNGDRILYHVAGHKGPYSYQFGYDTGKGHNRIFRFEEKDGKGYVKGKYGFYDKYGKLNIINYMAHPQHGYHAERGNPYY